MRFITLWSLFFVFAATPEAIAQDWSESRHRIYIDSLRELEPIIGAARTAQLMKQGMQRGAGKYPELHLDYLFSIQFQSFALSQRDSMEKYLPMALKVIQESGVDHMHRYYLSKGNTFYDMPQRDSARFYYEKSITELRRIGDMDKLAGVLSNLASTYTKRDELEKGKPLLLEAIALADSVGHIRRGMTARVNLANIFSLEGDYNNSAIYYSEAYDQSRSEGVLRSHVFNANNMGRLYSDLGQYEKAVEYFSEALVAAKEVNLRRVMAPIYMMKADYELLSDQPGAAESTIDAMLKDSLQLRPLYRRYLEMLQGKIQLEKGNTEAAYRIFRNIVLEYDNVDRFPYQRDVYLGYAKCLHLKGDKSGALSAIEKGLSGRVTRFAASIELLELKTKILEDRGNYKTALAANRERNIFADSLVVLNQIGIRLTEQARASLAEKESAMKNLTKDFGEIEAKGQRQSTIISFLIAGFIWLGLLAFFYSRHRKLRIEKDLADVKQSLLRIQINPHFIFNILNSIQSSFLQEDQEKTIHLFNKFSSLMRRVLENSTNSFIPLNEELELLINYMELEKARTKNKFDYEVNIDDDVDIYLEEVPTMVLQIFLENAVWHGVVPKSDRGKIQLNISKDADALKIAIVDNGVGRSYSLKNKSKDQKAKKSMGTDLVMQRVELLNQKFSKGLKLSITDGSDQIGTRVELAV